MQNEIAILGDVARVALTRGLWVTLDAADLPLISDRNWLAVQAGRTFYAYSTAGERIAMHRLILGESAKSCVDHIDGDGLNCRRSNLRFATHAENMRNRRNGINNTSGYKGVHWHKRKNAWMAQIKFEGRRIYLGLHQTPEAAHSAYREAAARLHQTFARAA